MKSGIRRRIPRLAQRGNALIEYVILLVAVVVFAATLVVEYGALVDAKWRGAESDSVWEDVESGLNQESEPGEEGCSGYYFNSATGRWHDSSTHLFVSFSDAEAAGC